MPTPRLPNPVRDDVTHHRKENSPNLVCWHPRFSLGINKQWLCP